MQNKRIIGISALILILLVGTIAAIVIYNSSKSTQPNENAAYTSCVNQANDLAKKNKTISDQVDAEEKQCRKNYIKAQGFNDDLECVGTNNTDPICESTERYNAEVDAFNKSKCGDDRDARLAAKGYKQGVPAVDCVKYLGK